MNVQGLFPIVTNEKAFQDHLLSITVLTQRALCSGLSEQ